MEKETKVKIEDLRAKHINHRVQIEGKMVYVTDVKPQVVNAEFICPKCKTILTVLQTGTELIEPSRCSCGNKNNFGLSRKWLIDAQRITVKSFNKKSKSDIFVFFKEDLTDPKLGTLYHVGEKVCVSGILREVPVYTETGKMCTRFNLAIEGDKISFK